MVVISLIITLGFLLFYVSSVQTLAAKLAANYLRKKTQINISLDKLAVRFPNSIYIEGFLARDLRGDTLIYCKELQSAFVEISPDYQELTLGNSRLDHPYFNLLTPEGDSLSNLDRVIQRIPESENPSGKSFVLHIGAVKLDSGRFHLTLPDNDSIANSDEINFEALRIRDLNARLSSFDLYGDSLLLDIENFNAQDPQGLELLNYSGGYTYASSGMHFQDFEMKMAASQLGGNLSFIYDGPEQLSNFVREVYLEAELKPSTFGPSDLGIFVPQLKNTKQQFSVQGDFYGPIAELTGEDVLISWGKASKFSGDFYTYGLPDIKETFIDFQIARLNTSYSDIKSFEKLTGDTLSIFIPEDVAKLGNIQFKGNFTGFVNDFVAYGSLDSDLGSVNSDVSLKQLRDTVRYKGEINCKQFDLGGFFENPDLGLLSAGLTVNGQGFSLARLKAKVKGQVSEFDYKDYHYETVNLDGEFQNLKFKGYVNSYDPNLNFAFDGLVDFSKKLPFYDFTADVYNIDLSGLNIMADTLESSFSGMVVLKANGNDLDNISGTLHAENISYCNRRNEYFLGDIDLSTSSGEMREIDLKSSVGRLAIKGKITPETLVDDINSNLEDISSVYFTGKAQERKSDNQDFTIECYLEDATVLSGILNKDFGIDGSFQLLGYFRSAEGDLGFNAAGDHVRIAENNLEQVILELNKNGSITDIWFNSEQVQLSNTLDLGQVDFSLKGVNDNFQSSLTWDNGFYTQGKLNGIIAIQGRNKGRVDWLPSQASFKQQDWTFGDEVLMYWDSTALYFENFTLKNSEQRLSFNGNLGAKLAKTELYLYCENFNLNTLDAFTGGKPTLQGLANGTAELSLKSDSLHVFTDFTIDTLQLNHRMVGDVKLKTSQNSQWNRIGLDGSILQKKQQGALNFYGYFDTESEEPLMLTLDFQKFDLAFLEEQFTTDVTQIRGKVTGKVKATGKTEAPQLNGDINIQNGHVFIPYLMCGFSFTDKVVIRPDYIGLNYIDIYDDKGQKAKLTGTVLHENFGSWNYDFFAELNNTQVLNTKRKDNSTFYGTAYLTGTIDVSGYGPNTRIEVVAAPEKNTKINIPLDGVEEVGTMDYVEFVNPNEDEEKEEVVDLSGMELSLDFNVNPNAEVNLIFDEAVGDIIRTTGSGSIKMVIDSRQNFEMFGKYEVDDGDYLFTLQNLINKKFNIQQGSAINWYGDPYEAILDIKADYPVRAPLYDILVAADDRFKRRELVMVQMHLTERLVNPDIKFDILLPNSDDFIRGQVKSAISTEQEMNRQVFSLLALNHFVPPLNSTATNEGSRIGTSTLGSSGSELLSNQISNIFSQISSDFNFGINYRSGDQLTRSEVTVDMSRQLFRERLTLSSNLGVTDRTASNPNGFVGDLTVEYSLTKDGKIRLKAFNETADNTYSGGANLSPFIQGVGVSYRTEFDNLGELWQKFKRRLQGRKEESPAIQEEDSPVN